MSITINDYFLKKYYTFHTLCTSNLHTVNLLLKSKRRERTSKKAFDGIRYLDCESLSSMIDMEESLLSSVGGDRSSSSSCSSTSLNRAVSLQTESFLSSLTLQSSAGSSRRGTRGGSGIVMFFAGLLETILMVLASLTGSGSVSTSTQLLLLLAAGTC